MDIVASRDITDAHSYDSLDLYLSDLDSFPMMDETKLKEIYKQIDENPEKKKELLNRVVESNLRLVIRFAKRYRNRGLEFPDIVQFGNLGLVKAAEKYGYKRGVRFSTCAS